MRAGGSLHADGDKHPHLLGRAPGHCPQRAPGAIAPQAFELPRIGFPYGKVAKAAALNPALDADIHGGEIVAHSIPIAVNTSATSQNKSVMARHSGPSRRSSLA